MALLVSTKCFTKLPSPALPTSTVHCKACFFLPSRSSSAARKLPNNKAHRFVSPFRVAAPPSRSRSVQQKEEKEEKQGEEGDYGTGEEVGEEGGDGKFVWRDHWYPVSLIEDLDPALPTPFQLLGRDLVLWFDRTNQEWVAFDDKCPHRLAPLSEGRIDENGHLQCSYHGWSSAAVDLAQGFHRRCQKVQKLVLSNLQGLVLLDSLLWSLKACSLFGQMRMAGKELNPSNLQCCLMTLISQNSHQ